ncbi:Os11g0616900 [Oryza sativa Japonica Group]|jgi:hypothetical protein|uniref:Os11g0616900 protein n=1 Tax=Oryza sativa subsp. japonica TaxID=39947 RepID=A0A0P0Y4G3_ORYSJ|nr:hypothetical protein EE612_056658 [Oryza sativa]BAT14873.1 Os11g0616900 [Oryza sativa Japonica Group]
MEKGFRSSSGGHSRWRCRCSGLPWRVSSQKRLLRPPSVGQPGSLWFGGWSRGAVCTPPCREWPAQIPSGPASHPDKAFTVSLKYSTLTMRGTALHRLDVCSHISSSAARSGHCFPSGSLHLNPRTYLQRLLTGISDVLPDPVVLPDSGSYW